MSDDTGSVSWPFAFEKPLDTWGRWFAVLPTRSFVRVDDAGFEAVYGLWRVATTWANVKAVEPTGPYRRWKIAGPARLSLRDRGITMAASTAGGVCIRFHRPVGGIDPFGLIRHRGLTLAVENPDRFVEVVVGHLHDTSRTRRADPPRRQRGRYLSTVQALLHWNRRNVTYTRHDVDSIEIPRHDRARDNDQQTVEDGSGPTFHRIYRITIDDATITGTDAMAAVCADPNLLTNTTLAPFTKTRGRSGRMNVGDRYVIDIAGPWKGAVEVIHVDDHSFRLATLEGHMESGVIEIRAEQSLRANADTIEFVIESWARSHDLFLHIFYDKLGIARALQSEMWSIACDRFVALTGGRPTGPISIDTQRATTQHGRHSD